MLYIFECVGGWHKVGISATCPWERFRKFSFWHMRHDPALCNRLGFKDVQLVFLFEGGADEEAALHQQHPPDVSEFYRPGRLPEILAALSHLAPLPLPPRPAELNERKWKRGCCLGLSENRRANHVARAARTNGETAPCAKCGRIVSIRKDKLKQHQRSMVCRSA